MGKPIVSAFESAARTSDDPLIGQVLGQRYQILRQVARGGMATIYAARHLVINRPVAVKVLLPEFAAEIECVEHFVNEGRAAGTLGHPNIVESTDMGVMPDGRPYLVLELLDGFSLDSAVRRVGRFSVGRAAHIGRQIASALATAHGHGIIHRDLKSDNVFLVDRPGIVDYVKVFDFGISKLIGHHGGTGGNDALSGTPDFMPPEQIQHPERVNERSDIYSLGMVLYHMLAGGLPWEDVPMPTVLEKVLAEQPPPLNDVRGDIPLALTGLINRMLSKAPSERPHQMIEVEQALAPFDSEPVPYDLKRNSLALPAIEGPAAPATKAPVAPALAPAAGPLSAPLNWTRARSAIATGLGVLALVGTVALVRRGTSSTPNVKMSAAPVSLPAPAPLSAPAPTQPHPPALPASVTVHLVATAPGAQATLRGKSFPLPYRAEIPRGSVPEVIRVTAPRCQGKQYWITLDQPRYLAIDLPSGSGVTEATANETAIALGEAAPTERAQMAIWRPSPARAPASTPAGVLAQPAAPQTQLAPVTPAPPPAPPPVAPKPSPAPSTAPSPAPAQPAAPSSAPVATNLHAPSVVTQPPPAPATSPKAPQPPVVPYGAFIASHKISGDEPHLPPSLRSALAESKALARVCIAADGHVEDVRVQHSPSAYADDAIRGALRGWRFRPFVLQGKPAPLCFELPLSFKRQ